MCFLTRFCAKTCAASSSESTRDQHAFVKRMHNTFVALAAASAGVRESLQRGKNAFTAWNVASCICAAPPGAAAAGCQSRNANVDVTTAQLAGRIIGASGVTPPGGDVTGVGAAAIAERQRLRTGGTWRGLDDGCPQESHHHDSLFARESAGPALGAALPSRATSCLIRPRSYR